MLREAAKTDPELRAMGYGKMGRKRGPNKRIAVGKTGRRWVEPVDEEKCSVGKVAEFVILFIIFLSAIQATFELQVAGARLGYDLKVVKSSIFVENEAMLQDFFVGCNWLFGLVFTFELVAKLIVLRSGIFYDGWNYLDMMIVIFWFAETPFSLKLVVSPMALRIMRFGRMFRFVKLMHQVAGVDQLILMVETIHGAKSIFFCSLMFLTCIMSGCSYLLVQSFRPWITDESIQLETRQQMFKYFGTFTRGFVSLSELTLGNFIPVTRFIMETTPGTPWAFILMGYKFSVSFALVSIIRGIFMQEVFKVAGTNDQIMVMQKDRMMKSHTQKMKLLFDAADESGDGRVGYDEFCGIMNEGPVKMWLSAQELSVPDIKWLFNKISGNDDSISADEMINGLALLKGAAKSVDVKHLFDGTANQLDRIERLIETHRQSI